jgi:integrase
MSKRGNNEGSIYKREDGRWVGQINLGYLNGKRRRKYVYGATRGEVAAELKTILAKQQEGLPVQIGRQTMEQFLTHWLDSVVDVTLAPKTAESYRDICKRHLIPSLGRHQLAKLEPQHVQELLQEKSAANLSPRTVAYIRAVLRIALNRALRWGQVARNVAALVDPPRQQRYQAKPFTPDEARTFLVAVRGDRLEALYTAALALGLRLGEALGLRWEDVDLDKRNLVVRRSLQRVNGTLILKEPKTTRSQRVVVLPQATVTAFRAHRIRQLEERLACAERWTESGLVFTSSIGTPMEPANATHRFRSIVRSAGLPETRFHDLRHCCASLLAAQGVPARTVMEVLGHSQLSTTMDLYTHLFEDAKQDAADRMDAILAASQ